MGNLSPVMLAFVGTTMTFLGTALGAATVFLFRGKINPLFHKAFLGFAAGIMIAASVWSLLIPAMQMAKQQGTSQLIPAVFGFILGGVFLFALDKILPHFHPESRKTEGPPTKLRKTTMLVLAVTLHNIPEGMAVGLSFGLAAGKGSVVTLASAIALAIGIGLQNLPEGAAISLPLRDEGLSRTRSFVYGALSGIVEPIFGVLAVLAIGNIEPLMPWLLAFAAGAMIYVVVEELIPEAHLGEHSDVGTASVMLGFAVMMFLDIALG